MDQVARALHEGRRCMMDQVARALHIWWTRWRGRCMKVGRLVRAMQAMQDRRMSGGPLSNGRLGVLTARKCIIVLRFLRKMILYPQFGKIGLFLGAGGLADVRGNGLIL